MVHKVALLPFLLLSFTVSLAAAQQPTAPPGSPEPQVSPTQATPPQQQPVPSNATTPSTSQQSGGGLPSRVTIDFVKPPGSDSTAGWVVALVTATGALIGVLITGAVTVSTSRRSAATQKELADQNAALQKELKDREAKLQTELQTELARQRAQHEARESVLKRELDEALAALQREHSASESSLGRDLTRSLEEQRIAVEREKLLSENDTWAVEIRIEAEKLVHAKQVEEAKLVHLYFDKLLPKSPERDLALIALSAFVDKGVIRRLALAGDAEVSRSILSQLAGRDAAQEGSNGEAAENTKSEVSDVRERGDEAPVATVTQDPASDTSSAATSASPPKKRRRYYTGPGGFMLPGALIDDDSSTEGPQP